MTDERATRAASRAGEVLGLVLIAVGLLEFVFATAGGGTVDRVRRMVPPHRAHAPKQRAEVADADADHPLETPRSPT